MRVEIQEGMIRMQRLPRTKDHKATVATTLRLAGGVSMGELQIQEEKRPQRVLFGDSWFASVSTVLALQDKYGVHFTGPIKMGSGGFPQDQMRWQLSLMERGEHIVLKLEGQKIWAVGWHDHCFKCYITTHGKI